MPVVLLNGSADEQEFAENSQVAGEKYRGANQ